MTVVTTATVRAGEEVWEITVPGTVWLQVTKYTRQGVPMTDSVAIGPNRVGTKFRISTEDREYNQERCATVELDPFRNGTLVRVDADQQEDPDTASNDALTTDQLIALFSKNGNAFHAAVRKLGEIPMRRMREIADSVDASAKQIEFLDEQLLERFSNREQVQPSFADPDRAERLS